MAVVVGVVVPPRRASFAEGDFGGVNFPACGGQGGVVADAFGRSDFAAGSHQFAHQTLASFFAEVGIRAAPQSFLVNEVAAVGGGRVSQGLTCDDRLR